MNFSKLTFLIVLGYYATVLLLINFTHQGKPALTLRERFGTIMWHSSDLYPGTELKRKNHLYCYYPGNQAKEKTYGEYIIKKAQDLKDCQGWYGMVIFEEENWVTEKEKIWSDDRFYLAW